MKLIDADELLKKEHYLEDVVSTDDIINAPTINLEELKYDKGSIIVITLDRKSFPPMQLVEIHNNMKELFPDNKIMVKYNDMTEISVDNIVHAHWITRNWGESTMDLREICEETVCSNCGTEGRDFMKYCPNCGAKMDEEIQK